MRSSAGEQTIEGSDILVAFGRAANTRGIGLEQAGITLDERGYVGVNECLQTSTAAHWRCAICPTARFDAAIAAGNGTWV